MPLYKIIEYDLSSLNNIITKIRKLPASNNVAAGHWNTEPRETPHTVIIIWVPAFLEPEV